MTWFLRKSLRFGQLRLNLSKRGLGASVGMKGARYGERKAGSREEATPSPRGRRRWLVLVLGLVLGVLAAGAEEPAGHPGLAGLRCIAVDVTRDAITAAKVPSSIGPTSDELRNAMLVGLKSRLPRLPVHEPGSAATACPNKLWFRLALVEFSGAPVYSDSARLDLLRRGTVAGRSTVFFSTVWSGGFQLWGNPASASEQYLEAVVKLLTDFAAEYYRADSSGPTGR